eukprot:CAMPEP_0113571568 /NCGR_PEP_ID=MMETSP0015_2-20120614/25623_1 /TAXON_ID=2838 /ORGANISM="Odontella" /LENGTH=1046 /DNA_ID=CAMNT_0000474527 /DNA_START=162 /DNA_END=3302 /DNA_ORIENTATION=- /assembly_acc=CAM_ASM_000160
MWGTLSSLAEKAKQAAEQIEGQLDASVGSPTPTTSTHAGPGALGAGGIGSAVAPSASSSALTMTPKTAEKNSSAFDDDAFYTHDDDEEEAERERQMKLARERLEVERQKVKAQQTPPSSAGVPRDYGRMQSSASMEMQFEGDYTNSATAASSPKSDLFAAAGLSSPTSTTTPASPPSSGGMLNSPKVVGLAAPSSNSSPVTAPKASPLAMPTTLATSPVVVATKLASPSATSPALATISVEEASADDEMSDGGVGWDGDDVDVDIDDVELDAASEENEAVALTVPAEEPKMAEPEPSAQKPPVLVEPEPSVPVESDPEPNPDPVAAPPAPEPEPETQSISESKIELETEEAQISPAPDLEPTMVPPPAPSHTTVVSISPAAAVSPTHMVDESGIILRLKEDHAASLAALQSQLLEAREAIEFREAQLASKSEQLASMEELHESEREELRAKVRETKDEAKKRILKAKDRCDEMQVKLEGANTQIAAAGMDSGGKDEIISQLRSEGEKLAMKQSQMEQRVREARTEARDLADALESETAARNISEAKCADLEVELKRTKDELGDARKSETRAGKLGAELAGTREESEKKSNQILGLDQQVKELKASNKELKKEMESLEKNSAAENERTTTELRRERDDLMSDLEAKLRTSEREAAVREDALRHEVGELRKRWQDAVRRADELSMDAQQSSAPLMRQLESTERQNRARAAAWAELEMKLRGDLEDRIMELDKLTKERNEFRATVRRLERIGGEKEKELNSANATIERLNNHIETLEARVSELEDEGRKIKEEWVEVERRADEGVTKVRTEMMQTVLDSEERYRAQITNLKRELKEEKGRRAEMEGGLEDLAETSGMMVQQTQSGESTGGPMPVARPKKLKSATDQADILQSAMTGLVDGEDDESDAETESESKGAAAEGGTGNATTGSFAAMEQLSQGLRGARIEIDTLRGQLASSEETREVLVAELANTRVAAEKLPLFEARVAELAKEVEEKDFEIMALREDIVEVRMMYRGQLDALLEEKAMNTPIHSERKTPNPVEDGARPPDC